MHGAGRVKCSENQCLEDYTRETEQMLSKRVFDHNSRVAKYHLVKNTTEKCDEYPKMEDFNIIGKSYRNNTFKWKVAGASLIKDITPTLNTHLKSATIKLFN